MSELKGKVVRGTVWALLERFSNQLVLFVVGLILARMLTPEDYGTVALLGIFTAIASVLATSGFGNALIQKKNADELDYNSVFYFSLVLSGTMYAVLFFSAPYIANFYKVDELCPILRVTALSLVFNAINSIQNAELHRKLLFHLSFRISLISTFASAGVGIAMAYLGYGTWALVWSGITGGVTGVITRWFFIAWRPRLMFSFTALGPLFRYGWKMMVSALLDTGVNNLYGLIIGKFYSCADLAFVNKGRHPPALLMNNVNGTLATVALPALAQMQDDRHRVREAMRRMMICSSFVVFPLMAMSAVIAERAIPFLYGDQWGEAVPYMQLACFTFALWPFHTVNLQGIQAIGRSDVFLKLEIIKKVMGVSVLLIFIPHGVIAYMAASAFICGPLGVLINAWPNRRLLDYTVGMQIKDIASIAVLSVVAVMPAFLVGFCFHGHSAIELFLVLTFQCILCAGVYVLLSLLFKTRPTRECFKIIQPSLSRKFPKLTIRMQGYLFGV